MSVLDFDQWVIDCLNPLKSEKLLIVADARQINRAGPQAVDAWSIEN